MVVDTSALLAVIFREPDAGPLEARLLSEPEPLMSAGTLLECAIVLDARAGPAGTRQLDELLRELQIRVVPVDAEQVAAARAGFRRYGKGRHDAGLNYGDCFAYGLAITLDAPLLFKGADFSKTDVRSALA
jgi:ribonuclease VapC